MKVFVYRLVLTAITLGITNVGCANAGDQVNLPVIGFAYVEEVIIKEPPRYVNYLAYICVAENPYWKFSYFEVTQFLKQQNTLVSQVFSNGSGIRKGVNLQAVRFSEDFLDKGEIYVHMNFRSKENESYKGVSINLGNLLNSKIISKYKINEQGSVEDNICAYTVPIDKENITITFKTKLH